MPRVNARERHRDLPPAPEPTRSRCIGQPSALRSSGRSVQSGVGPNWFPSIFASRRESPCTGERARPRPGRHATPAYHASGSRCHAPSPGDRPGAPRSGRPPLWRGRSLFAAWRQTRLASLRHRDLARRAARLLERGRPPTAPTSELPTTRDVARAFALDSIGNGMQPEMADLVGRVDPRLRGAGCHGTPPIRQRPTRGGTSG